MYQLQCLRWCPSDYLLLNGVIFTLTRVSWNIFHIWARRLRVGSGSRTEQRDLVRFWYLSESFEFHYSSRRKASDVEFRESTWRPSRSEVIRNRPHVFLQSPTCWELKIVEIQRSEFVEIQYSSFWTKPCYKFLGGGPVDQHSPPFWGKGTPLPLMR